MPLETARRGDLVSSMMWNSGYGRRSTYRNGRSSSYRRLTGFGGSVEGGSEHSEPAPLSGLAQLLSNQHSIASNRRRSWQQLLRLGGTPYFLPPFKAP